MSVSAETDIFELGVVAGISAIETFPPDDLDDIAHRVATQLEDADDHEAIVFVNHWWISHITKDGEVRFRCEKSFG